MRVLVVGNLSIGSNARSLAEGFGQHHEVRMVDTSAWTHPRRFQRDWVLKRYASSLSSKSNSQCIAAIREATTGWKCDVAVFFKTILFEQDALLSVKATRRVHYSPDDVSNPENLSKQYLDAELEWDAVVTTKRHNVPELTSRGVQNPIFVMSAFDPDIHYAKVEQKRFTAGFIGAMRPDRNDLPRLLSHTMRGRYVVAGPKWRRKYPLDIPRVEILPPVMGTAFSDLSAKMHAGLVLLNSANRDTHTCRTFEVPATGVLGIMQRTAEHETLFDEGSAVFVDSLRDEVPTVLERVEAEPRWAAAIAEKGHRVVTTGGHTYAHRASEILERLG